ncbi:hypothetical protein ES708_22072 [subsurface metagenome]
MWRMGRSKGFYKWKDMIFYIFGDSKSRWEKYTGKVGLKNAVSKLRVFKEKNQKNPKVRENGLSGIKRYSFSIISFFLSFLSLVPRRTLLITGG